MPSVPTSLLRTARGPRRSPASSCPTSRPSNGVSSRPSGRRPSGRRPNNCRATERPVARAASRPSSDPQHSGRPSSQPPPPLPSDGHGPMHAPASLPAFASTQVRHRRGDVHWFGDTTPVFLSEKESLAEFGTSEQPRPQVPDGEDHKSSDLARHLDLGRPGVAELLAFAF